MTEEYEAGGMPSEVQFFDESEEVSLVVGGEIVISLSGIRNLEYMDKKEFVNHPNCRCSTVPEDWTGERSNV